VWRLLNCRFLKTGLKVCLFACVGDHRPCPRLHCLFYALWRPSEFTLIYDGHEEYELVSVPRLCRNDQFLGFVRGQTEQVEIWSLLVPIRMRRPPAAPEALGRSPTMEARWAHSSGVERIPQVATGARPQVILPGATSRRAGIGCLGRRDQGSSPDQGLDPRRRTGHP
jgi:hypothetical protein